MLREHYALLAKHWFASSSQWTRRRLWCCQPRCTCDENRILHLKLQDFGGCYQQYCKRNCVEMPPGEFRERRSHESDLYPVIGSSLTGVREVTSASRPRLYTIYWEARWYHPRWTLRKLCLPLRYPWDHPSASFGNLSFSVLHTLLPSRMRNATDVTTTEMLFSNLRSFILNLSTKSSSPWPLGCYLWAWIVHWRTRQWDTSFIISCGNINERSVSLPYMLIPAGINTITDMSSDERVHVPYSWAPQRNKCLSCSCASTTRHRCWCRQVYRWDLVARIRRMACMSKTIFIICALLPSDLDILSRHACHWDTTNDSAVSYALHGPSPQLICCYHRTCLLRVASVPLRHDLDAATSRVYISAAYVLIPPYINRSTTWLPVRCRK